MRRHAYKSFILYTTLTLTITVSSCIMQFLSIHPLLYFSQTFRHEIQDDSQQEPPDEIEDSGLDIGRMTNVHRPIA